MFCTTNRLYLKNFLVFLLPFLLLSLAACGGSGSSGGSSDVGKTAAIEMDPEAETLAAGSGSVYIDVQLTDSTGNPVDADTSVIFRTNIGSFDNGKKEIRKKTADESGMIRVSLNAPIEEGNAEVEAESNGVSQTVEISFLDPDKFMSIDLSTGSNSIVADGSSRVAVIARLTGRDGNPVEGLRLTFKTTLGRFQDQELSENGADNAVLSEKYTTAVTDVEGEARVLLTSGRTSGQATITAEILGIVQTTSVLFLAGEPVSMNVRAMPDTIRPQGTTDIIARVFDINDNPVPGQEVIFTELINGSGGELEELSSVTNVNGDARVSYSAGGDAGADIIQASLASDRGMKATTTVLVDPGAIVVGDISLTVGSPSLVANGTSQVNVRAVVTDVDGNPASGKSVRFSTTAGTLTAASETTSATGLAEVSLRSSRRSGPVIVRAECNGFIAEANVEFVPGPATQILLYAFPNVVPPNGEFQTAAIVMDANDNRIDDIRLTLELRRRGNSQIIDQAEMTPDQAEDGVYRYDWIPATDYYGTGDLQITARINNGVNESVFVRIREGAILVGSITLTAGSTTLDADGNSTTAIRATVLDNNGQPAGGVPVSFSTTLGSLSSYQQNTNASGIAEVSLRAGTVEGNARVIADANGWRDQVNIEFVSGTPGGLDLAALPAIVSPGGTSSITATLTDETGSPIAGEALNFDISQNNSGGGLSATTVTTNAAGKAYVTYTAGSFSGTDSILVVSVSNSSIRQTTTVQVETGGSSGTISSLSLMAGAETIPADGSSEVMIRATVQDNQGAPVADVDVTFATTLGTLVGTNPATTNASGIAEITLRSGTDTGTARVTATASGFVADVEVLFVAGAPDALSLNASPATVTPGNDSVITATLTDSLGNPLADQSIAFNFTTNNSGASLSGTTATTNINGEATITYTAGSNGAVTDTIRAVCVSNTGVAGSVNIDVDASAVSVMIGSLSITASSMEIVADGTSNTAIRARLIDIDGNPVSGRTVAFTTSYGTLSSASAATGPTGIAEVVLTSDTRTGVAVVMASIAADAFSDQVEVQFVPGPPVNANSSITVQPSSIPADGTSTAEVTVTLADANGNPVLNGTQVELYASRGTITTGNPAPTASGRATFTIQAPLTTGTADLSLWDYPDIASAQLGFGSITSGDPASVRIESVSHTEIAVTGVGQNDNTAISVRIADETGSTVINPDLSLLVELLAKPDGGEFLSGEILTATLYLILMRLKSVLQTGRQRLICAPERFPEWWRSELRCSNPALP